MGLNAVELDARLVGPPAGDCVDGFAQLFLAQSHRLDVVDPRPLVEAEFLLRDGQIEKPILPASQGASRCCWPWPAAQTMDDGAFHRRVARDRLGHEIPAAEIREVLLGPSEPLPQAPVLRGRNR